MPAPTYNASGEASSTWAASTPSPTITIPAGAVVGDLGIIVVAVNGAASNNVTITGWTRKYQTGSTWGDVYASLSIHYRRLVSGDPGSTVTISNSSGARGGANLQCYQGALASGDPFEGDVANESASSGQPASLSVVTTEETTIFTAITIDSTSITTTAPTNFTHLYATPASTDRNDTAHRLAQAAGTQGVQWSLSTNNRNNPWAAGIKGAAADTSRPRPTRRALVAHKRRVM